MKWITEPLNSICDIGDGAHASLKRIDSGILYLTAKNITSEGIDLTKIDYISEETYKKHFRDDSKALTKPKEGDILYSIIGSIGGCYLVKDERIGVSSSVAIFRCHREKILPDYLYYYIKGKSFYQSVQNIKGGVAQGFMSLSKLGSIEVVYPEDITCQQKITAILSAYDKLIENNQKQVKILEEAAQRLYKEWFVDLRFPGYEDAVIVDGVPEKWKEATINDLCLKINAGGTPSRRKEAYYSNEGYKWFKTKELLDCWLLDSEEHITIDGLNGSSAKLFPANTVVMAIYASPTLGRLGVMREEACTNQAALCMSVNEDICSWQWLYQKLYELRDEFNAIARGAGQQNISGDAVKSKKIILPDKTLLDRYTSLVAPIFEKKYILTKQIVLNTQARDRLLPKLMSGEIEV